MTVEELIRILSTMPQKQIVFLEDFKKNKLPIRSVHEMSEEEDEMMPILLSVHD